MFVEWLSDLSFKLRPDRLGWPTFLTLGTRPAHAECFPAASTVTVWSPASRMPERRTMLELHVGDIVQVQCCRA